MKEGGIIYARGYQKGYDSKKTKFILFSTREDLNYIKDEYGRIFDNYDLIRDDIQRVEGNDYNMFLFQVKGD